MKILLINGPNLNLLGSRETKKYGDLSLKELEAKLQSIAKDQDCELLCFQSNSEEKIINEIHEAGVGKIGVIIINPAAFTHTSIAIRDAILAVDIPFYEVHITDIKGREPFRHHSFFEDIAIEQISGKGISGYEDAVNKAIKKFRSS
tara:strand:+ start:635 stop:1075 length:441 start_codon:yes stop_codon:yes gene_type:complete